MSSAIGAAAAWLERGGLIVPSARADGSNLEIVSGIRGAPETMIIKTDVVPDLWAFTPTSALA